MTPPPRRRGTDDGFSSAGGGRYGRRPPAGGPRGGDRSDTPAGRRYGKSDDRRFAAGGGGRPHDRGWRKGERDGSGGQRERYGSDRFGGSAAEGGYRGKEDRFAADRRRGRYQDGSSDERAGRRSDNRGGDQWRHGERDDLSRDDRSRGGFPGPDRGRFRPEASGERRRDGRDGGRTGGFKRAGERDSGRFQRRDQAPDAWSHGLRPARPDDAGLADDLVWGRHAAEAVLSSDRPIHRIWCTPELRFTARFMQLLREAKAAGVVVEEVTWTRLVQLCGGAVHQGIVLQTAAAATLDLDELLELCRGISEAPLVMAVDGVTDPHNLGAIVRTAEALGANGMVIPQRRNAGLTGTVAKVAAGALEHLPVARVVNLNRSLEQLKLDGYTVVGLAEEGDMRITEVPAGGPLVVVTGSEGSGLSLMTRKHCDHLVSIPLRGETTSLNASVATGMVLYEIARKRWLGKLSGTMPPPPLAKRQRSRPGQAPCEPAEAVEPATAAAETLPAADISTTSAATATSTAVAAANGIACSEAVPSNSRQDIAAPLPPTLDD
ncbi:MAG: 23S rRNA (guanosine(2251)-2'-O)-methyltransferase RlmB, partial [Aphanocapsa feldmannii 277cV]